MCKCAWLVNKLMWLSKKKKVVITINNHRGGERMRKSFEIRDCFAIKVFRLPPPLLLLIAELVQKGKKVLLTTETAFLSSFFPVCFGHHRVRLETVSFPFVCLLIWTNWISHNFYFVIARAHFESAWNNLFATTSLSCLRTFRTLFCFDELLFVVNCLMCVRGGGNWRKLMIKRKRGKSSAYQL